MKKISILLSCALGLLAVACDDAPATAPVQSNQQPTLMSGSDVAASPVGVLTSTGVVKLQDYAATTYIPMMKLDKAENLPADAYISYKIEIAATEDMAGAKSVAIEPREANPDLGFTPEEGVSYASTTAFNDSIMAVFGTGIEAHTVYYRVTPYVMVEGADYRVGSDGEYAVMGTMTVTRTTPEVTVDSEYYLVGNFCDWDVTRAIKFEKLDPSVDQYASSVFTLKADLPADTEWKILPKSSYDAGNLDGAFGCNAAIGVEGSLVAAPGASADGAGLLKVASGYFFTIDMTKLTCLINFPIDRFYVPGQGSSENNFSRVFYLITNDYVNFNGIARLRNRFYFTGQDSNSGMVFSLDGEQTEAPETGVLSGKMLVTSTTSEINKMPAGNGLFYLSANVVTMEYTATPIKTIGLVGQFNGWDVAGAVAMTPSSDFLTWTGEVTIPDDKSLPFKFCCNNSWDINFGGTPDNIVVKTPVNENPDNVEAPGPGTYTVTLKLAPAGCTATIVAK